MGMEAGGSGMGETMSENKEPPQNCEGLRFD